MNFNSLASPWTEEHIKKNMANELKLVSIPFGQRSNLKKKKATFVDIALGQKSTLPKKCLMSFSLSTSPFNKEAHSKTNA
jgi:hypothetical protein